MKKQKKLLFARNIFFFFIIIIFTIIIMSEKKDTILIPKATKRCVEIMKEFKPDLVLGIGGYVTYPVSVQLIN